MEERLGEGGEERDEEERGLGGEHLTGRGEESAVGAAGGAQGEEVLEGGQAAGDVRDEVRRGGRRVRDGGVWGSGGGGAGRAGRR
uniref:Uncharacterized protein n=1 Tax=Arundo donax TaxID=35708 RepID=A0A0A9FPE6_ARUDO